MQFETPMEIKIGSGRMNKDSPPQNFSARSASPPPGGESLRRII